MGWGPAAAPIHHQYGRGESRSYQELRPGHQWHITCGRPLTGGGAAANAVRRRIVSMSAVDSGQHCTCCNCRMDRARGARGQETRGTRGLCDTLPRFSAVANVLNRGAFLSFCSCNGRLGGLPTQFHLCQPTGNRYPKGRRWGAVGVAGEGCPRPVGLSRLPQGSQRDSLVTTGPAVVERERRTLSMGSRRSRSLCQPAGRLPGRRCRREGRVRRAHAPPPREPTSVHPAHGQHRRPSRTVAASMRRQTGPAPPRAPVRSCPRRVGW